MISSPWTWMTLSLTLLLTCKPEAQNRMERRQAVHDASDSEQQESTTKQPDSAAGEKKSASADSSSAASDPTSTTTENAQQAPAGFSHEGLTLACGTCHEPLCPAAAGLGLIHGGREDCGACHFYDVELKWSARQTFAHDPKPEYCQECHGGTRPQEPHPQSGDCISCHQAGVSWLPLLPEGLAAVHDPAPAACETCHAADRPAEPHVQQGDCVSCHTYPNWAGATFLHDPKPETCESCHARPAQTYGRAYPNQGPPANFDPNDPNFPGSGHLVGKDCVNCHLTPEEGAQSFSFSHSQPVVPFCLPCHYNNGQGEHRNDNDVSFAGFGNCFQCHQQFDRNNGRTFD